MKFNVNSLNNKGLDIHKGLIMISIRIQLLRTIEFSNVMNN